LSETADVPVRRARTAVKANIVERGLNEWRGVMSVGGGCVETRREDGEKRIEVVVEIDKRKKDEGDER